MILGNDIQHIIDRLLEDVQNNPKNPRYFAPFALTKFEHVRPVWLYFWSPVEQFDLKIMCPHHNLPFKGKYWASDVINEKVKTNPRLLFCLHYNVVLIQRFYTCGKQCYLLSGSKTFMDLLPEEIFKLFEFKIYCRSGFSFRLIDYMIDMLVEGSNFNDVSQSIANLKIAEYIRGNGPEHVYDDILVSFPSTTKLQDVFLDIYQTRKLLYENAVNKTVPTRFIVTNRWTNFLKSVCSTNREGKISKTHMSLFLVSDEKGRIIGWKLADTLSEEVIQETLEIVNKRSSGNLQYIISDNCCRDKDFNERIFGENIPTKMDLYFIEKEMEQIFSGTGIDFNSIFRAENDVGEIRGEPTPSSAVILENLNSFIEQNQEGIQALPQVKLDRFNAKVLDLIDDINNDCLSGIGVGHGVEKVMQIQSILDNGLMRATKLVSYELVVALLSLHFYSHNNKVCGDTHHCNSSIIPFVPLKDELNRSIAESKPSAINHQDLTPEQRVAMQQSFNQIKSILLTLKEIKDTCRIRSFCVENLVKYSLAFADHDDYDTEIFIDHSKTLNYNLNSFQLQPVREENDNDDCFRSILRVLYLCSKEIGYIEWRMHLINLGLTLQEMDKDIPSLRYLFVQEVKENPVKYREFLETANITDVDCFKQTGTDVFDISNIVLDACCTVLKVSISVIKSPSELSMTTFIPKDQMCNHPLFIGLNVEERYFIATKPLQLDIEEIMEDENITQDQAVLRCGCKAGCIQKKKLTCPCAKDGKNCSSRCSCRGCGNNKVVKRPSRGCGCGKGSKDERSTCVNNPGSRSSKCPCLRSGIGCRDCMCRRCANPFGLNTSEDSSNKKRKFHSHISYRKKRTDVFLADHNSKLAIGAWSLEDAVCLYQSAMLVYTDMEMYCSVQIETLYDLLTKNCPAYSDVQLQAKTGRQIQAKLREMRFTSDSNHLLGHKEEKQDEQQMEQQSQAGEVIELVVEEEMNLETREEVIDEGEQGILDDLAVAHAEVAIQV